MAVLFVATRRDVDEGATKATALGFRDVDKLGIDVGAQLPGVAVEFVMPDIAVASGHIARWCFQLHLEHRVLERHSRLQCPLFRHEKHLPVLRRTSFLASNLAIVAGRWDC